MPRYLSFLVLVTALTSCGSMQALRQAKDTTVAKISSLRPQSVPVVEVREKDLKELPTGKERALAYERKRGFWLFSGPVKFVEPALPEMGADMDAGLLPPKPN